MDIDAAVTLASAAAGGAATAAGQSAWQSLVSLVRRDGRTPAPDEPDPASVDPSNEDAVRVLVGHIADRARDDEAFAADLIRWAEAHRASIQVDRSEVHNTVSGNAKISGNVIMARDIQGGINLG
ncbi:hypothetical protein [Streptomyces daliensis]|uniref:Uncharacterized protein n=1 Tax=Streptomyces daliensis TaxID=299421 RepID=A0A8T4IVR9_9ACTN|nr:hypothetical protein [Streptomyces daliensis]